MWFYRFLAELETTSLMFQEEMQKEIKNGILNYHMTHY